MAWRRRRKWIQATTGSDPEADFQQVAVKAEKRRKEERVGSEVLGENPKGRREQLWSQLEVLWPRTL